MTTLPQEKRQLIMSSQALLLVDVDATGKVTFKNVGSNWERITATPKSGGPSYIYEIRVKSWWVNSGDAFMIYSLAENFAVAMATHFPVQTI